MADHMTNLLPKALPGILCRLLQAASEGIKCCAARLVNFLHQLRQLDPSSVRHHFVIVFIAVIAKLAAHLVLDVLILSVPTDPSLFAGEPVHAHADTNHVFDLEAKAWRSGTACRLIILREHGIQRNLCSSTFSSLLFFALSSGAAQAAGACPRTATLSRAVLAVPKDLSVVLVRHIGNT